MKRASRSCLFSILKNYFIRYQINSFCLGYFLFELIAYLLFSIVATIIKFDKNKKFFYTDN